MERKTAEEYLKSILKLQIIKGYAKSVDVAKELGITRPSVSNAMKALREDDMIMFDEKGHIVFTDTGKTIAEKAYQKHIILTKALLEIGVEKSDAANEARMIERVISEDTYKCLETFFKSNLDPAIFE